MHLIKIDEDLDMLSYAKSFRERERDTRKQREGKERETEINKEIESQIWRGRRERKR